MEMTVHLHPDVFEIVKQGQKDIEARVNDLKRRKLQVGDTLIFLKRPLEEEHIVKTVKDLQYYDSFEELVQHYEMRRIYLDGYTKEQYLQEMARFYTEEAVREYGVVAILFE